MNVHTLRTVCTVRTVRTVRTIRVLAVLALCASAAALSQPYPSRAIEIVNAFAPGGANDLNVRALQAGAEKIFGHPLVQTFRQGGGGIVGTTEVANAPPDGYKLLIASPGELTAGPNLAKTTYSLDSFAFVGRISSRPYGFVVRSDATWKEFVDFRHAAAREPGRYTLGTTPQGGVFLAAQYLVRRGGLELLPVPYGGSGPYLLAVLGGHVDAALAPLASAESYLRSAQMRLLAVTGPARSHGHPAVPSFRELGIDAPFVLWQGVVAPRAIAPDRLAYLREGFARIVKDPAYLQAAEKVGIEVAYAAAEEFEKQVREEDQVFRALARDLGVAPK